jgi:predicted AAA+ superfamily ATPase
MPADELKPWREVAIPRQEVADGSFDESVFAADLGLVDRGRGPRDYVDPVAFCEKTYLTNGLRAVLVEIAARLRGDSSAAGVYRLQTEFGGGKTHTLLAAYHLFRDPAAVAMTPFAQDLAVGAGGAIPRARVAVLDGSSMAPGTGEHIDGSPELRTLLGQLAYRLGGDAAYSAVRDQDSGLLGSSTTQLAELLEAHAPCLILLDETLEYLNKALSVAAGDGNLAGTTLTFIKELCTAASNVPGAVVVATLTSSRLEDYASVAGEEMQERLSMVVGRTENIVTPVEGDDIFPILHRRLLPSRTRTRTPTSRSPTRCQRPTARPATASGSSLPTRSTLSSSTS